MASAQPHEIYMQARRSRINWRQGVFSDEIAEEFTDEIAFHSWRLNEIFDLEDQRFINGGIWTMGGREFLTQVTFHESGESGESGETCNKRREYCILGNFGESGESAES